MSIVPKTLAPYTDKYFLRSLEILQKENLNPFVRAQIFVRKGPGKVAGIQEVLEVIKNLSLLEKNGGRILSLQDGDTFAANETIIVLEGRAQDVIPLETVILGIISAETSLINGGSSPDANKITENVKNIVSLIGNRSVVYFGARHWRYDEDARIAEAAFLGGATDASTDAGAQVKNKKGVGTIPHSLECIFAWKYGMDAAVLESIKAFDRHIDPSIPRIALIDFNNREIDDALLVAKTLGKKLWGVRVDTSGENLMQGLRGKGKGESNSNKMTTQTNPYWYGKGVTVNGVYALRTALNEAGYPNSKIILSSGFGDVKKVAMFVDAEKELHIQLFDSLGVGELFPVRAATMDIVGVGETVETIKPVAKVGRAYSSNLRLQLV